MGSGKTQRPLKKSLNQPGVGYHDAGILLYSRFSTCSLDNLVIHRRGPLGIYHDRVYRVQRM